MWRWPTPGMTELFLALNSFAPANDRHGKETKYEHVDVVYTPAG